MKLKRAKSTRTHIFCTLFAFTLIFLALPATAQAAVRQEPSFRTSVSYNGGSGFVVDGEGKLWVFMIYREGLTKETQYADLYQACVTDHVITATDLAGGDYLVLKENGDLWLYHIRDLFPGYSSSITSSLICRDVAILKEGGEFLSTDNRLCKLMFSDGTPRVELIAEGVLNFLSEDCYITQSRTVTIVDPTFDNENQLSGIQQLFENGLARFALMENGDLYGWGYNDYGSVGNGGDYIGFTCFTVNPSDERPAEGSIWTNIKVHSVYPVLILQNVAEVFPADTAVYAVDKSGTYWQWGGAPTPAYGVWTNGAYELVMPPEQYLRPAVCPSYTEPRTSHGVTIADDGSIWVTYEMQYQDAEHHLIDNDKKVVLSDIKRGILGADFYVSSKTQRGDPVSSWAAAEVNEVIKRNLFPAVLAGKDLRRSITRREFADVAVTLCESLLGTTVQPDTDAFTDTDDIAVLKAYRLGVTNGVGGGRFSPEAIVTREEAAVMLRRAYTAAGRTIPGTTQAAAFTDRAAIADWAYSDVRDMAGTGIVRGNTSGQFCPKDVLSREAGLLLSLRLADLK